MRFRQKVSRVKVMEGPEGHEKGAEFHSQMSLAGHVLPPAAAK